MTTLNIIWGMDIITILILVIGFIFYVRNELPKHRDYTLEEIVTMTKYLSLIVLIVMTFIVEYSITINDLPFHTSIFAFMVVSKIGWLFFVFLSTLHSVGYFDKYK